MKIFREITPVTNEDVFAIKECPNAHFNYPLHTHPEIELTLILKSAGKRIVGDSIEKYEGPDLVMIGPGVCHKWDDEDLPEDKKNTAHVIVIQFSKDLFSNPLLGKQAFAPIKRLLTASEKGICFYGQTRQIAESKIKRLIKLKDMDAVLEFLKTLNFLATSKECRFLLNENYSGQHQPLHNQQINKVCDYLQTNFTQKVQISEVAEIVNMSESAFSHFFKKSTSKSFTRYLIDLRLSHACKLLLETQQPVSQICYQCGFNNISNFNRLFKKYKGLTPFDYRAQYDQLQLKNVPYAFQPLQKIS